MAYTKICKHCSKEYTTNSSKSVFCSSKCRQDYSNKLVKEKHMKELLEQGVEGVDYVIDLWNGLPTERIYGNWMKTMHPGKTTEDYKREFPGAALCCSKDKDNTSKNSGKHMKDEKYRNMFSEKFKGENNPNHKSKTTEEERKERSPFAKEFYEKRQLNEEDRQKFIKDVRSNVVSTTNIKYYLNKGYSKVEALKLLKDRQRTNTLSNYIKKYGEEIGPAKFKERNDKWTKDIEERYSNGEFSKMPKTLGLHYSEKELTLIDLLLDELGLTYDDVQCIKSSKKQLSIYSPETNKNYFYDFCYNNKIIEFNGDFWHMNPSKFKEDDTNNYNGLSAKEIWNIDESKRKLAEENGYKILTVWEHDFENDLVTVIEECKKFILS